MVGMDGPGVRIHFQWTQKLQKGEKRSLWEHECTLLLVLNVIQDPPLSEIPDPLLTYIISPNNVMELVSYSMYTSQVPSFGW